MTGSVRRWHVRSTVVIIALSAASSLLGLLREGHYNDAPALLPRLYAQDLVILVVGVPVLALGLFYATQGSLGGRIVWLGTLAFMAYMWVSIAGMTAFNEFFLGYVTSFALSLFTLLGGVARTDVDAIRRALEDRLSTSAYAGFLALVAMGLALLWLSQLIPATLAGTAPPVVEELGETATYTYVLDLGVVVPSLLITAIWLRRGRTWGYLFAGVLLVMAALLAPTLTAITVVDVLGDYVTVSMPLVVGTILPPTVALVVAAAYLYQLRGHRHHKPEATR